MAATKPFELTWWMFTASCLQWLSYWTITVGHWNGNFFILVKFQSLATLVDVIILTFFFIIDCIRSCHVDNFWCSQWWKFCWNEHIHFSEPFEWVINRFFFFFFFFLLFYIYIYTGQGFTSAPTTPPGWRGELWKILTNIGVSIYLCCFITSAYPLMPVHT